MKISVVIPTYNGRRFLLDALESVYAQTLLPEEVIVVNDGSTDDTEDLLRSLQPRFGSLRWVSQSNHGVAHARNRGVELTTGDTIAFLDHDDVWRPRKLERQARHLLTEPQPGVSFVRCEGEAVLDWDPDPDVVIAKMLGTSILSTASAVLVRRAALDLVPPFDVTLEGFADDWLMWLNLAASRVRIDYLPEVLAEHRVHGGNLSADGARYYECACEVIEHFFAGDIPSSLRAQGPRWRARWHMLAAIDACSRGDRPRSRRHIITAARTRPLSVRAGWVRML